MNIKNTTFAAGLAFLIYGALFLDIPDWDIGVSLVMAFCTYCTADWVIKAFRECRYKHWPLAVFFVWFSVDGSYFAYWSLVNEDVMVRAAQWLPLLMMYLLCWMIWNLPTWKQTKEMISAK